MCTESRLQDGDAGCRCEQLVGCDDDHPRGANLTYINGGGKQPLYLISQREKKIEERKKKNKSNH